LSDTSYTTMLRLLTSLHCRPTDLFQIRWRHKGPSIKDVRSQGGNILRTRRGRVL